MTLRAAAIGVSSIGFTAGVEFMSKLCLARRSLAPERAEALRLWRQGPDHHVFSRLQLALKNRTRFRVCVVCNSNGNLDRLERVIEMEFPHHRAICFRRPHSARISRRALPRALGPPRILGATPPL